MTDEEKRRKENEKKVAKFHKKLGVLGKSQSVIDNAVLNFAKGCSYGWGELFLTDEQQRDATFMLKIFKANKSLLGYYYIPQVLKGDHKFVLGYLKMAYAQQLESSLHKESGLDTDDFHITLKGFVIRKNPEFLNKFAREFPECNILELVGRIVGEESLSIESEKEYARLVSGLEKDVFISGARRFGAKFVKNVEVASPYFMEILMTGIEKDGFDSLAYLPRDMIVENRDLIVLASKVGGVEGLRKHFLSNLSPDNSDLKLWPIRQALIKDDALFDAIDLPEADKKALRDEVAKKTQGFYEEIKPIVLPAKKEHVEQPKTVPGIIAQNIQNQKNGKI